MKKKEMSFWLNVILALIVLLICIEIEILNFAAGGYLPRKDNGGKWRQSPFVSEDIWRNIYSREKDDETLLHRSLTKDERDQMEKVVSHAHAWNSLHGFVSTFGLMQYFFASLSFVWSLLIAMRSSNKNKKVVSTFFIVSTSICIVMMFYRGYFTSLGW